MKAVEKPAFARPGRPRRLRRLPRYLALGSVLGAFFVYKDCACFAPEVIATTSCNEYKIVVDESHVFFFAQSTGEPKEHILFRMFKSGGNLVELAREPAELYFDNEPTPFLITGLTADKTHLYWAVLSSWPVKRWTLTQSGDTTRLMSLPKKGGKARVLVEAESGLPFKLTVDDRYLYWISSNSALKRVSKSGGKPEVLVCSSIPEWWFDLEKVQLYWTGTSELEKAGVKARSPVLPWRIDVDETHLYWTGEGQVCKIPKSGGRPVVLAWGQNGPTEIAVDETHVYWINQNSHEVMRVAKSGGWSIPVAILQLGVCHLAMDDSHLYWTRDRYLGAGTVIVRLPKFGAYLWPFTFVSGDDIKPVAFAVDKTHLYWVSCCCDGRVRRVSKWGL